MDDEQPVADVRRLGRAAPDQLVRDPAAVLDLQDEVVVRRPDLEHAAAVRRVREGVDRQFLRDEPDVGEPVVVHSVHPAGVVHEHPGGPRTGGRPDDDELGVARSLAQRDVERRGDRAGVGVGGARPALGRGGQRRVGARGVREDGRRQLRGVVRALDVGGRLAERDVDQRLVLGAGGVLLVRPPRPDRLADDAYPAVGVLADERGEHGADDPAGVAARDGHVAQPDARHLLGRQRLTQEIQVPAGYRDEHGLVAPQPLAHEAEHAGDVLVVVRVEQRVVLQGAQRAGLLRRRRHGTVSLVIIGPPAARAARSRMSQARSAHHRNNDSNRSACRKDARSRQTVRESATEGYDGTGTDTPIPPSVSAP